MPEIIELRHATVVTPTHCVEDGRVIITGDRIAHVGSTPDRRLSRATTIDAEGLVLLPGIIDLHGDDIEHHHSPRAGATMPLRSAVMTADRLNLLNGITTKFHAIAFENPPDDERTLSTANALATEITAADYTLADNRLHARCELTDESIATVVAALAPEKIDLLSVMHHAPGEGQYDADGFERHYHEDQHLSTDRVARLANRRQSVPESTREDRIARIVDLADRAGAPLASHDDSSPAAVDRVDALGATISEYPLTLDTIQRATERGLTTVMGAPNLQQGGSLSGNLDTDAAIDADCVDVLCADYHPPSLLAAPFVDTGEPLPTRVNRVTRNPADAVGLTDRGRIEVGARADLILVDPEPTPSVERVFVGGRAVAAVGSAGSVSTPTTRSLGDRIPAGAGRPRHGAASSQR